MPNYGLVVTPQYNPMSYEQYAKPFEQYAQVYNQMADAFDTLEMEANQWEKLANSEIDSPQYQQYRKYADDLRAASNALSEHGLNPKTRGIVSQMRKRYAGEIKPISDAYELREEERKMQRQAQLQHPDIMFSRDAATTGLGAYMAGTPELQTYNGEMLTKYTAHAAKNLAREARDELIKDGKKSGWYKILGEQYYEKAMRTGLTADEVISALYDPATGRIKKDANPYLKRMIDDAILQSGMMNWGNWKELEDRARTYAGMGLWESIGQVDYKNLQSRDWDLKYGAAEPIAPPSKLWDWIGTDVDVNGTNKEIRQSADDLEFLQRVMQNGVPEEKVRGSKYPDAYRELNVITDRMRSYADKARQEASINGTEWNPDTDATYIVMNAEFESAMNAARTRAAMHGMPAVTQVETITDNPDYKRFVDLQKKYGITDPTELYNAHNNAHNEFIKVNKYTVLNNTTGTRVMRYLGNQVTSGMNDETLNGVIWQEDKKGKKTEVTPETARKALSSKDSTIQINFTNGKVRINNIELGTFYLDKSAFHNLTIPVVVEASTPAIIKQMLGIDVDGTAGVIPGDTYIETVVQLQQYMRNAGYSKAQIDSATNEFISNFYTHLEANTRNMTPESPVTSSKL